MIQRIIKSDLGFFEQSDQRRKSFLHNILGISTDLDESRFKNDFNKLIHKLTLD